MPLQSNGFSLFSSNHNAKIPVTSKSMPKVFPLMEKNIVYHDDEDDRTVLEILKENFHKESTM